MPRISELSPATFNPELSRLFDSYTNHGAHFGDQFSILAHVPSAATHLFSLLAELKQQQSLPYRYVELAIVVVSLLNDCQYCVSNHAPRLQVEGISAEGALGLLDYANHPELDEVSKLVVEYAIAVTDQPQRIGENVFTRLRAHFSEKQIVELTLRISLCGFFNRFNQALQIGEDSFASHS